MTPRSRSGELASILIHFTFTTMAARRLDGSVIRFCSALARICARRTDADAGWGLDLVLDCHRGVGGAASAPDFYLSALLSLFLLLSKFLAQEGEVVLCEAALLPSVPIRLPSRHAQLGADLDRAQAWMVLQESRPRLPRGLPAACSIRSGQ